MKEYIKKVTAAIVGGVTGLLLLSIYNEDIYFDFNNIFLAIVTFGGGALIGTTILVYIRKQKDKANKQKKEK